MSSRATAEAAPEPLIQNVPAESSAALPRQTRPQHIDDEATDIECDPPPLAPEPDDIFSTSDTRTRPTYRPEKQCFINASLTALFACGPVRRLLQDVHRTKSTAPPSARWRAYNKKLKLIASHPRTTPFDEDKEATLEEDLALTFLEAIKEAPSGRPCMPELLW